MSLNTGDQGYNNGKKNGQKGTICGPNNDQILIDIMNHSKDLSL